MQAQHETDKLELQNQKMEMEAMHARNVLIFMGVGVLVLVLICALLVFLVCQKHRLGEQFKLAKEKAEEADRIKSAFLANMNHEIRTRIIMSYCSDWLGMSWISLRSTRIRCRLSTKSKILRLS